MALALALASAVLSVARAESSDSDIATANASNGGFASGATDGNVTIEQVNTGENAGNTIVTGDIAGSAAFDGGETSFPTDVSVSQTIESPLVDAGGGDSGEAVVPSSDDESRENGEGDVKIINRNTNKNDNQNSNENDNRSKAVIGG